MSALRSLKREVIRNQCYRLDHKNKRFRDKWDYNHYTKYGLDIPKREKGHVMNKNMLLAMMRLQKEAFKKKESESGGN